MGGRVEIRGISLHAFGLLPAFVQVLSFLYLMALDLLLLVLLPHSTLLPLQLQHLLLYQHRPCQPLLQLLLLLNCLPHKFILNRPYPPLLADFFRQSLSNLLFLF